MDAPQPSVSTPTLHVTLVVAATIDGVIGRGGDMPWRLPSSLKRFRALTMGRPMIMGRKTYQSIGRALDGRDTVVVTRNADFKASGVYSVASIEAALSLARGFAATRGTDEIVIAGGGEIYAAALPYATCVHLDRIAACIEGDTVFPSLDAEEWEEIDQGPIPPHPRDDYAITAILFRRIGPPKPLPPA